MLDYLLAAALLIVTLTQLLLVYACHDFRKYRLEFSTWMQAEAGRFSEGLTEYGAILDDIATTLENGAGGVLSSPTKQGPGESIGQILSNALISRMAMGAIHAESQAKPERTIHEGEQPETQKESTD
jgi:hypothetical protein